MTGHLNTLVLERQSVSVSANRCGREADCALVHALISRFEAKI
jgi:hypothetical protein